MTITLELPEALGHQLREEAARNGMSLDKHIVQNLSANRLPNDGPLTEMALLQKINLYLGIAPQVWRRYDYLNERLRDEQLSETEHQELLTLIDVVENANAERLKYLVDLSGLRGVSLRQVMFDLGIHPRGERDE